LTTATLGLPSEVFPFSLSLPLSWALALTEGKTKQGNAQDSKDHERKGKGGPYVNNEARIVLLVFDRRESKDKAQDKASILTGPQSLYLRDMIIEILKASLRS
jgi:hypothetical protein